MATLTSLQHTAISNLYIALFNRAPDAAGFEFWGQALANGASLSTITGSFLASPESTQIYPSTQTSTDFVASFYQTVFGRAADAGGLAFWTSLLNGAGGTGSAAAKALLVSKIVDLVSAAATGKPADMTDAQYAEALRDRELFNKKSAVGVDFALNTKSNDLALAKQVLQNALAPAPEPTPVGTMFTLTLGADKMTGGAGNDTFTAGIVQGSITLDTADILDGGAGIDTLNVTFQGSGLRTPTLRNIEIINVQGGSSSDLNLGALTGLTHARIDGNTGFTSIINVGNAALAVANTTSGAIFTASTAATLSLNLSDVGVQGAQASVVTLLTAQATKYDIVANNAHATIVNAGVSVTAVSVAATGANALTLSATEATNVTTLTVTGKGSIDFSGQSLSALTAVTATGAGIKVTSINTTVNSLTVTTGAGADTIVANGASIKSLQTGAGNDTVTLNTGALSAGAVVDLGAGDDTIKLAAISVSGATVNGGSGDDIIETAQALGMGLDSLTGGTGADLFVFRAADLDTKVGAMTAIITDFVTGTDQIKVAGAGGAAGTETTFKKADAATDWAAMFTAADETLAGDVKYYVGQFGNDSYLFTDGNGEGYSNVIKLTGVALTGIVARDLIAAE